MKILPTIGPETIKKKNLRYLLSQTDMVRLNSSHNTIRWHIEAIKKIKNIKPSCLVLIDFPGVKPRTMNSTPIKIKRNQKVCFSFNTNNKNDIKLSRPLPKIQTKNYFSIDDGKLIFKIIFTKKNSITGRALEDCVINPSKGLNIPGSIYDNYNQEKTYLKYYQLFLKTKIDAVGLSFIQNKNILIKLKKKYPNLLTVSKVENSEGLKNINEISEHSDLIMIDRGDLSAEIGDKNLYDAISKISYHSKKNGRPLIMATENLETFYKSNNPSRNDIVSLGFSKQMNSDIIMLSEETAISPKWKRIFNWLKRFLETKNFYRNTNNSNIFWKISEIIKDHTLVIFSREGLMFREIFKNNLNNKVYVFTDKKRTFNLARYYKNTQCVLTNKFDNKNIGKFYLSNLKKYKKEIFKKNKYAFLITISFPKKGAVANTLSLIEKKNI